MQTVQTTRQALTFAAPEMMNSRYLRRAGETKMGEMKRGTADARNRLGSLGRAGEQAHAGEVSGDFLHE